MKSRLLAGAALRPMGPAASFLGSLSFQELQYLRAHIRAKFMVGWPKNAQTDRECDRLIEVHGPAAKEAAIRKAVNSR
jgi:hypothetical protein